MRNRGGSVDPANDNTVDGFSKEPRNRLPGDAGGTTIGTADQYFVRIERAADWLGCKVCFLRRLVAQRRIPHFKVGKYLYFDLYELDAWVRRQRIDPSSW